MEDIFARIVLGHLAGDYLFQNKKMALMKSEKGSEGALWCFLHSALYTSTLCLFLWEASPLLFALILASHYPFDRWSLASRWLKLIKGRDFIAAFHSESEYREIDIAFSCLVYAVSDNTIHLILMWAILHVI